MQMIENVQRYPGRWVIHKQDVAQHSHSVSYNALKIMQMLNLLEDNELVAKVLTFCVLHDMPEAWTSDIPYDVKHQSGSDVEKALEVIEQKAIDKYLNSWTYTFKELNECKKERTLAYLILKYADTLDVLDYCKVERTLGNMSKDIENIYTHAEEKLEDLFDELQHKLNESGTY